MKLMYPNKNWTILIHNEGHKMILDSRSPNKKYDCLRITMYCMDVKEYPSLDIYFKDKVQCPDFTLFLPGLS